MPEHHLFLSQVKILVDKVADDAAKYSPKHFVLPAFYQIAGVATNGRFPHIKRIMEVALNAVGLSTQVRAKTSRLLSHYLGLSSSFCMAGIVSICLRYMCIWPRQGHTAAGSGSHTNLEPSDFVSLYVTLPRLDTQVGNHLAADAHDFM